MKRPTLAAVPEGTVVLCCISSPFGGLSTTEGKIAYVLLTRAPLYRGRSPFSHDLHVLGAPLTFVLSQDQTLQLDPLADVRTEVRTPPWLHYGYQSRPAEAELVDENPRDFSRVS